MGAINDDERIALFLDYENLAIGARDGLGVRAVRLRPGRRRAGRARPGRRPAGPTPTGRTSTTTAGCSPARQVELIEIPQRLGGSRKNAADIKMAVDAIELAYERGFITTFAIGTGDSDFTPLVHKLRELDKRVIGIGVQSSTSALLPPACDEFLFYDRLPGVEPAAPRRSPPAAGRPPCRRAPRPDRRRRAGTAGRAADAEDATSARWSPAPSPACSGTPTARCSPRGSSGRSCARTRPSTRPTTASAASASCCATSRTAGRRAGRRECQGDPRGDLPAGRVRPRTTRSGLLVEVVRRSGGGPPQLSGLKNQLRQRAARLQREALRVRQLPVVRARGTGAGLLEMEWDDTVGDHRLHVAS